MRIVSGCLAGIHCRYDGDSKGDPRIVAMVAAGEALPICPEQAGGLPTPRTRSYLASHETFRLVDDNGVDVTVQYSRGAAEALRLAKLIGATEAILKEGSPSCGSCRVSVLDGEGHKSEVSGAGITTTVLRSEGITVFSEENWQGK
ncbi:MAG TPA: DUF523 domain-containing protein [Chloroflexota bacterium]|nr:DUF523 domain-containing protein [Chloroflexota bacterium]